MLQITRRAGERIVLDGGISIVVLEVSGGQVKVGVDAPREVRVYRGEIWDAIAEENRAAADAAPDVLPLPPGSGSGSGG
jgi:carbon storage regulator